MSTISTSDAVRLRHMLDAAQKARHFIHNRSRSDLDSDELLSLALVRLLEIVGEAATRVSTDVRTAYPTIPWQPIADTRNRLIHGYYDVDLDIVWTILQDDLPSLIAELEPIVASVPPTDAEQV
jgi:uncharacterized protein with HEPN domain